MNNEYGICGKNRLEEFKGIQRLELAILTQLKYVKLYTYLQI